MIFIICLFAVSAVSATDNATSDVLGIEETTNEVVGIEENNSVIGLSDCEIDMLSANSDASFTDLANDIANANGEFKLSKNYVYDSTKDSNYKNGIMIDKEIVINGRGFIINGDNQARAFNVNASNVILRNIEFINCSISGSGGAVYWNGADGSLFDCNFINCNCSLSGGAVYWNMVDGSLFDCNFINCHSYDSTIQSTSKYGGAIYWNEDNGHLSFCNFTDCYCYNSHSSVTNYGDKATSYAYSYGGAVYWKGYNGNLLNCNFNNCYSYSYGYSSSISRYSNGAIREISSISCYCYSYGGTYWKGNNGSLYGCNFINSISTYSHEHASKIGSYSSAYSDSYTYAGAVYWSGDNGSLFGCNFINSNSHSNSGSSDSYGGAIYWSSLAGAGCLSGCSFINCHVYKGGLGSAIYWQGIDGVLSNSSFINSTSTFTSKLGYNTVYCRVKMVNFSIPVLMEIIIIMKNIVIKADTSTVYPVILINTYSLKNDNRIVVFESTQLANNISVELYNVTDRKILCDKFNLSSEDLTTSYTVNNLEESEYQIYLTYGGDKFFTATSKNDLFKIGKNSSYEVEISDCVAEGNVTINITLNEDATGKVKLTLSNHTLISDLVDGKASFYIPYVNSGINEYKIKYVGDEKYNPIYINGTFNATVKSNSSISLDLNENYTFGENIPLNYDITPNSTGIISILVDNAFERNITVGEVFELDNINAGAHNIAVIYNGDRYFLTSNDSAIITVLKAIPSFNVNSHNMGSVALFEVILNEKATGNVTLTLNNKSYSKALVNGKANITVPDLTQGNYSADIIYYGDSNYNSANTIVDVVVNKLGAGFLCPRCQC